MANKQKPVSEKRSDSGKRQNAQGEHAGTAHSPEEFKTRPPQKQGIGEGKERDKEPRRPKTSSDDR